MGLANSFLAVFVYMVGSFFTQTTDSRTAAVVEGSVINKLSGAPVKSAHVIYTRITSTTGGTVTPISADTDAGGNFTLHLRLEHIGCGWSATDLRGKFMVLF